MIVFSVGSTCNSIFAVLINHKSALRGKEEYCVCLDCVCPTFEPVLAPKGDWKALQYLTAGVGSYGWAFSRHSD